MLRHRANVGLLVAGQVGIEGRPRRRMRERGSNPQLGVGRPYRRSSSSRDHRSAPRRRAQSDRTRSLERRCGICACTPRGIRLGKKMNSAERHRAIPRNTMPRARGHHEVARRHGTNIPKKVRRRNGRPRANSRSPSRRQARRRSAARRASARDRSQRRTSQGRGRSRRGRTANRSRPAMMLRARVPEDDREVTRQVTEDIRFRNARRPRRQSERQTQTNRSRACSVRSDALSSLPSITPQAAAEP